MLTFISRNVSSDQCIVQRNGYFHGVPGLRGDPPNGVSRQGWLKCIHVVRRLFALPNAVRTGGDPCGDRIVALRIWLPGGGAVGDSDPRRLKNGMMGLVNSNYRTQLPLSDPYG
jgi:hypothetical protein